MIGPGERQTSPADARIETERTRNLRAELVSRICRFEPIEPNIAAALMHVQRHLFVPDDVQMYAYDDGPLPIGWGQTVSQPTVVAMMTQALHPHESHRVLEIGTGSGYQAAVLSRLVRQVETIEIVEPLALRARRVLELTGCSNVRVHIADGNAGLSECAPFDGIILTAAPLDVPVALWEQLRLGGRLVAPVGSQYGAQTLLVLIKHGDRIEERPLCPVRFVPMIAGPIVR